MRTIIVNKRTGHWVRYTRDDARPETTDVEVETFDAQDVRYAHGIMPPADARTHYRNKRAEGFE